MDLSIKELSGEKVAEIYFGRKDSQNKLGDDFESLGKKVYHKVKEKIIFRDLKPGERIIDREIADEFGVSRSLVRQALNILEKEGLVNSYPRTGYYVKEITKKDIRDIYNLRKLLEQHAAKKAVSKFSDDEIRGLEKLFKSAKEDLQDNLVEKLVRADAKLHRLIINKCCNRKIKEIIKKFNSFVLFYRVIDLTRENRAQSSYEEHYEIFKAIKNRQPERTAELLGEHIEFSKSMILENYDKYTFGDMR